MWLRFRKVHQLWVFYSVWRRLYNILKHGPLWHQILINPLPVFLSLVVFKSKSLVFVMSNENVRGLDSFFYFFDIDQLVLSLWCNRINWVDIFLFSVQALRSISAQICFDYSLNEFNRRCDPKEGQYPVNEIDKQNKCLNIEPYHQSNSPFNVV